MTELDDRIRAALAASEPEPPPDSAREQGLLDRMLDSLRGRSRRLVVFAFSLGAIFYGLGIAAAVRFFHTESTRDLIALAVGFLMCAAAVTVIKLWYWMELNRNAVSREIKRVELQVARMAERLPPSDDVRRTS